METTIKAIRAKLATGPMAVFFINGMAHIIRADSKFCKEMINKHSQHLMGVYNNSVTDEMLIEDLGVM